MSDIVLSKAVRSNLLNLQNTASMLSKTQERLATGKKVNSALDNPTNFFTAQTLNSRASDLSSLLDSMSNGIQTIEAADNGIETITSLVESAQSSAKQALQDKSAAGAPELTGSGTSLTSATTLTSLGFAAGETISIAYNAGGTSPSTSTLTLTVSGAASGNDVTTVGELVSAIDGVTGLNASIVDGKLSISFDEVGSSANESTITIASSAGADDFAALGFTSGTNSSARGDYNDARETLSSQFNDILDQISAVAADSSYNGVNLLNGDSLKVSFNENDTSKMTIAGTKLDFEGLGLSKETGTFQSDTDIQSKLDSLTKALSQLRTESSKLGSSLSTVEARENFTNKMINTLESGAANLTLADTNEEGANMLALQTRQTLSTTALSLASQADQNVLRLF